ncbi:MAG TPA: GDSL-type esterase/lipase family protein [Iamia sp.]|nr:GDSL-type esterase/lipase family protein [Iamia sp.]
MLARRRTPRAVARIAALLLAAVASTTLAGPAGAAQTAPWGTAPAGSGFANGPAPGVVVVGDSLVTGAFGIGIGEQPLADHLRTVTGRQAYVSAASGASWVTYGWPGQQNGNSVVWDLAAWFQPSVVVGALGHNDARIMASNPGSYSSAQQLAIMQNAVTASLAHAGCVLLVNTRTASGNPTFPTSTTTAVNANMATLDSTIPGVYVADWNAHSAGQASWFTDGVHMTAAGKLHYAAFISGRVQALRAAGC